MRIYIAILLLISCHICSGQATISGHVYAKRTSDAIPFVSISVMVDSTFITGTVTDAEGFFFIKNITHPMITLKAEYLGLESQSVIIEPQKLKEPLNIHLQESRQTLDEVVIVAEKTTIEFHPDKRVVNIGRDLLNTGTDAGTLLNQIPSIEVSPEGTVSLRNNENVVIMIDGQRSRMSSADAIAQIPPDLIKTVEIITNPSAKYEAEGATGMINIITHKIIKEGGNLSITAGMGQYNMYNAALNGNYRKGKVNIYANSNYYKGYGKTRISQMRRGEDFSIDQNSIYEFDNAHTKYAKMGIDVHLSSKQVISLSGILSDTDHIPTTTTSAITASSNNGPTSSYYHLSDKHEHINQSINANYRNEIKGAEHYVEVDFNHGRFANRFALSSVLENSPNRDLSRENNIDRNNDITTISADYYRAIGKSTILEMGLRTEYKHLHNAQAQSTVTDTTISIRNDFDYRDKVTAAYAIYGRSFGSYKLKLGMRAEDYSFDFDNRDAQFRNHYFNIFPSVSFAYDIGKMSISGSYARRISRPRAGAINPFTVESRNLEFRRGNPELSPSFTNKYELNSSTTLDKVSINISIFYSNADDEIQNISVAEGQNLIHTYDNVGSSRNYGIEIHSSITWPSWLSSNVSANLYKTHFSTAAYTYDTRTYARFNINNTIKLDPTWRLQLSTLIFPNNRTLQRQTEGYSAIAAGVSKQLFNKRATLTLRVSDVLRTQKRYSTINTGTYDEIIKRRTLTSRRLYLTYRHNITLGKSQKSRKRQKRTYTSGMVD